MSMTYAVLDTNTFLHFQPIDKVDWTEFLGAKEVTLIIPCEVPRELNKQKDTPGSAFAERAANSIRTLNNYVSSPGKQIVVRNNTYLEFATHPKIDYEKYHIDKELADGRIIACAIDYALNTATNVILVTDDVGMKGILRTVDGISFRSLQDAHRLPRPLSNEGKDLKRVRDELAKLKNRQPDLKLTFLSDKEFYKYCIPDPDVPDIAAYMNGVRSASPKVEPQIVPGTVHTALGYVETEYNKKLDRYYARVERWLRNDLTQYHHNLAKIIPLNLVLKNQGRGPANDIEITLAIEGQLAVTDRLPEKPSPPSPPSKDTALVSLTRHYSSGVSDWFHASASLIDSSWEIDHKKTKYTENGSILNIYRVSYFVDKLKHCRDLKLKPLYININDTKRLSNFKISYELHSDDLLEPTGDVLNVVLEAGSQ